MRRIHRVPIVVLMAAIALLAATHATAAEPQSDKVHETGAFGWFAVTAPAMGAGAGMSLEWAGFRFDVGGGARFVPYAMPAGWKGLMLHGGLAASYFLTKGPTAPFVTAGFEALALSSSLNVTPDDCGGTPCEDPAAPANASGLLAGGLEFGRSSTIFRTVLLAGVHLPFGRLKLENGTETQYQILPFVALRLMFGRAW